MKLTSIPIASTLLSLLAASGTLASPLHKRDDPLNNKQFGLMSIHSGNSYVHLHPFYVGDSGAIYLDPTDGTSTSAVFSMSNGRLVVGNLYASVDSNGTTIFKSDANAASTKFSAGDATNVGYNLLYNGTQSAVACPASDNDQVYQVYFGAGNGNPNCAGIAIEAFVSPSSSSSSSSSAATSTSTRVSSSAKASTSSGAIAYTTKCVVVPVTASATATAKAASAAASSAVYPLFPHGIRLIDSANPSSNSGNVYSPVVFQKQNNHTNTIFTFDVPQVSGSCELNLHLDTSGFPITVEGSNGVGQFILFNLSSVANDSTVYSNRPNRIAEIGRFNCSSSGCDYATNVTCPNSYTAVSYEMMALTDDSYLSFFEEADPLEGLTLRV
ncbi:But2 family protein, similar to cell surface molecules [Schizosaccharomyces pombe]|uniref:Uncharacterized but2-like protein C27D7.09c n=1 Tax=Schizosaccharomyces pombe (strain 972 / ATCC 24843) TaxID=284812 RepID=YF89_SCHPO|nr:But2 family protein [Schizosaccharomyces pombe]O42663.1 RecName: Full=Uncharacterized but2-like protein C27D7.09c; Flags: Precursor [Schizosaccharomyces pombe 972h-]CAA15828.1 But2 family protein [Schizosaccharomyces pombe]|eukprot:NP_594615.1 But2 family protein [Schizosaccharomyces pombe]